MVVALQLCGRPAVFAPKVVKPQVKAAEGSTGRLAAHRSAILEPPLGDAPVEQALTLQRRIGNQATLRHLAVSPVFSKVPLFPPERESRAHPFSVRRAQPRLVQPKLAMGPVDDPLEREADAVADRIMRMPDPALSISAAPKQISRKCAACEDGYEEGKLRTKPAGAAKLIGEAPAIVREVLRASGRPLDSGERAFFETLFDCDFSEVRVHTDDRAAESARSIGASAYTAGWNIAFTSGRYAPATPSGRRLLAHELTHVVQQRSQPAPVQRDMDSDNSAPAVSADYEKGYQDGLNGLDSQPDTREGDALTDYNEGYAKGHYEFSQQSASGTAPSPSATAGQAPTPAVPVSVDSTVQPPASGAAAVANPYAGTGLEDAWKQGFDDGFAEPDADHPAPSPFTPDAQQVYSEGVLAGKGAAIPAPSPLTTSPLTEPPVFFCGKSVAAGLFKHAFFRVGGAGPSNPTFELEHDELGDHCTCGFQGHPTSDYPEDRDAIGAPCVPLPGVTQSCLAANFMSYPIGRYCATGPNSNTYARWLAEKCGAVGVEPPGGSFSFPGFNDNPPKPGTAASPSVSGTGVAGTIGLCGEIDCDNDFCLTQGGMRAPM